MHAFRKSFLIVVGVALASSAPIARAAAPTVALSIRLTRPAEGAWIATTPVAHGVGALAPEPLPPTFRLTAPVGVPVLVCVGAKDVATQCRAIVPESDAVEEFTLDPGRTVVGRCFVGRAPAEGARVYVVLRGIESRKPGTLPLARDATKLVTSVVTGADGRFRIDHLAPGEHPFEIHLRGGRTVDTESFRIPVRRRAEASDAVVTLPDIRVDPGAGITVVVTDDAGLPVPHAKIGILQNPIGEDLPRIIEGEGDEKAQARLTGLDLRTPADLSCSAPGYARGSVHLETLPATATCAVSRFAMLVARVEDDERHEPIPGAVLSIRERTVARTNETGDLIVRSLVAGTYDATIAAPGFAPRTEHLTARPGATADLGTVRLRQGRTAEGTVIDGETKAPVSGAGITVHGLPGSAAATTDGDGRFAISVDPDSVVPLDIAAVGYAQAHVTLTPALDNPPLVVPLSRAGSLEVMAWNDDGSGPCVACSVGVVGNGIVIGATTDARGVTRFSDLAPGDYDVSRDRVRAGASVVVVSSSDASRTATVRPRETTHVELGAVARTVRVVLNSPVDAAWHLVVLSATTTQTLQMDGTGAFLFRVSPGESYTLRLESASAGVRIGTLPATFRDDIFTAHLGTGLLRLRAAREGIAAPNEVVILADAAGGTIAWGRSRADGLIAMPFLPAGGWTLRSGGKVIREVTVSPDGVVDLGTVSFPLAPR